jgi:putative FmdB family regulatory protein
MPIYEYRCTRCRHEFELFARMGAKPPAKCPKCGEPEVERKLSPFASGPGPGSKGSCSFASG